MNTQDFVNNNRRPEIYTVSVLTEKIKDLLEEHFDFIWVEGEISNFSSPSSGHFYMVLKDESSQIRSVMFRTQARYLKFRPEDGMKVIAQGRIGLYQRRGEYQLILDYIEPLGIGAFALAFDQLKKKLSAQGIFDEERKKPLPFLPGKIAVITSPTGAAIQDFLKIILRRFSNLDITILPVKVQGDEAAAQMINAIKLANNEIKADVIVLTRGGGSMEDLWAFNNEDLALAIRASDIPVVSAVGHEIDITISDLAADLRAPTPSAAAELLVNEKKVISERIEETRKRLQSGFRIYLDSVRHKLALLAKGLPDPRKTLSDSWMRLDEINAQIIRMINFSIKENKRTLLSEARALQIYSPSNILARSAREVDFLKQSLIKIIHGQFKEKRLNIILFEEKLNDLSPVSVLKRGYSITRKLAGKEILKDVSNIDKGERVNVLLAHGNLDCRIEKIHH
ncbi:MAG: exodeoxyribonuclease VII large subunit [Deltaproteobacteria bacterium]|nr:exodeoxyribonuclease VII large subunit [Deltaproteobacteria bacterium]